MWLSAFPQTCPMDEVTIEDFVTHTIDKWKNQYGSPEGFKIARVDVRFHASPDQFVKTEGTVITPVGLDLPGKQKILETATYPPAIRELNTDGIKAMAWSYPGKCRINLHYVSLCLIREVTADPAPETGPPSYESLPKPLISDALAKAAELEEHSLDECAAFPDWSSRIAVQGSYLDQFKSIVSQIAEGIIDPEDEQHTDDDICAAMRKLRFSRHRAQVLAVMACRQIGIPCFGFISATGEPNYLVGTYSDQTGWIFFDFAEKRNGFFSNSPVLLTKAPLISEFEGCQHDYWYAGAAAYNSTDWGVYGFSWTKWGMQFAQTDSTIAQTYNLNEWRNEKQTGFPPSR